MALNENLQGVVNDLKTAKDNIATAITSKEQPLPKDAGFNDFAGEINKLKPSSYQDVSGVTATASDVLSGKTIVDANGAAIPGNIPTLDTSNKSLSVKKSSKYITALYQPDTPGYHRASEAGDGKG